MLGGVKASLVELKGEWIQTVPELPDRSSNKASPPGTRPPALRKVSVYEAAGVSSTAPPPPPAAARVSAETIRGRPEDPSSMGTGGLGLFEAGEGLATKVGPGSLLNPRPDKSQLKTLLRRISHTRWHNT